MIRALLVLTMLFPAFVASAQEPTTAPPPSTPQEAQGGPRRHGKLFLGFRTDGGTDFTLGAELSQNKNRGLGLAGFAELIFADDLAFLLGGTVQYHTGRRIYVETGPAFAFDGGSDFLWRVGAGYELSPFGLTITPKLYLDFVSGETLLGYGILLGRRF